MTFEQYRNIRTRRHFLDACAGGACSAALAHLMGREGRSAAVGNNPLAPRPPHFAPKAKNLIFLFMPGLRVRWIFSIPSPASKNGTAGRCPLR